ncbi:MAG: hypothetical protein V4439_03890 [Patescibacteria group bacterium]
MENVTQIAGWVGTVLIVGAYFLVSSKKVAGDSKVYQIMNLFGAIGVGANVFYQYAWPSVALQSIWAVIAISSLIIHRKKYEN